MLSPQGHTWSGHDCNVNAALSCHSPMRREYIDFNPLMPTPVKNDRFHFQYFLIHSCNIFEAKSCHRPGL